MTLTNVLARISMIRSGARRFRCYCNCDTCKVGRHCRNPDNNCDF
jgi:hypothetical protein